MSKQIEIAPGVTVAAGPGFSKPVLKGTNVQVTTVLHELAAGRSFDEIATRHRVTSKAIKSALSYATEIIAEERTSVISQSKDVAPEIAPGVTADLRVRFGKPVIKGTRIDVTTVLGALAAGDTPASVAEAYRLNIEAVLAAVAYAHGILERESVTAL